MSELVHVQMLMSKAQVNHFDSYCREKGYRELQLIAQLVRDYLDSETFDPEPDLFGREQQDPGVL